MCKDCTLFRLCRLRYFLFFLLFFPNAPTFAQNVTPNTVVSSFYTPKSAIYAKNDAFAATLGEAVPNSKTAVPNIVKAEKAPVPTWLDRKGAMLHKWMGYLSLLLSVLLLAGDKSSKAHRVLGRMFVPCLVLLNVSALAIKVHGFTFFHYLAIVSLIIAVVGMLPLMLARTQRSMVLHITCMYGSIIAVFTGGVTEALVRIPFFPYYGDLLHSVMVGVPTTVIIGVWLGSGAVKRRWYENYVYPLPEK